MEFMPGGFFCNQDILPYQKRQTVPNETVLSISVASLKTHFCWKFSRSIISEFTTVDDNSPRFHPMPLHHLRPGQDEVLTYTIDSTWETLHEEVNILHACFRYQEFCNVQFCIIAFRFLSDPSPIIASAMLITNWLTDSVTFSIQFLKAVIIGSACQ